MVFESRDDFQCGQAAESRQEAVDHQREDGYWRHVVGRFGGSVSGRKSTSVANLTLNPSGDRWTSSGCLHRGKNMSYPYFTTKYTSVLPMSKRNKSTGHNSSPYRLSLRAIDAIICSLSGCLNSTSDISLTVKSRALRGGGTSGQTLK